MKLKVINERLLRKIVKVSLVQIAMFLIFTNVTMAKPEKEDKKGISTVESSANVLKKTFLAADIKGTVSDDKGEKLPGVNVIIKGTSRGTSTNANGEFSLSNVNNNDVLVLTYVGYESQEIQINNKTDFSIVLKTDAKALEEVVVVGYGTQKRSNITGSISTIKAADLSKVQSPSFDNALQGKSPGVYVSSNGGQPGGGIAVRIRGVGAINNSNPLYIIDGIQRDPGNNENANPLASINSNDIESIDVLKDAASTAIYGARAANGVVLITTKRGSSGKAQVNYSTYVGFQNPTSALPRPLNATDFAENMNAAFTAAKQVAPFADPKSLGAGTNWMDAGIRQGFMTDHQLSISGGSAKNKYYISIPFLGLTLSTMDSNM